MKKAFILLLTHAVTLGIGFALGVYVLPILIAPAAPSATEVASKAAAAIYTAEFRRDLKDSDLLHWGEGKVTIARDAVTLTGKLAPGPDYKLYFSPVFVETEAEFLRLKPRMVRVGEVKTFDNFVVQVPPNVDPAAYNAVIIWCERFGQFITAAKYR